MPIFEYKCQNCQKISEFILKVGEAPTGGCKHCGEKHMERVMFSTFAVAGGSQSAGSQCNDFACPQASSCCGGSCSHKH